MSKSTINKKVAKIDDVETQKENNTIDYDMKIKNRYSWLIFGAVILVTIAVSFISIYLVVSGRSITIDVATILTTLLAFFSIFLSSVFYFKATEQSNQFYDRSYNHTRDIAMTLSAMEGKFGEALKNIERYSTRLNDRFDNLPLINNSLQENVLSETQKNLKDLMKSIEEGSISVDDVKKYEEKFSRIENENKVLKEKIKRNKISWTDNNRISIFFHNIVEKFDVNHLLSLSEKDLSGVIKNEAITYMDKKFLRELINSEIIDSNLNLTNKGRMKLVESTNIYNK